jgi:hypothetical protein
MKFVVGFLVLVILAGGLFVVNAVNNFPTKEQRNALKVQREASVAQANCDRVVAEIRYYKDPRTGFCFAYYWGGAGNGGPALSLVPEEKIPAGMLLTAELPAQP